MKHQTKTVRILLYTALGLAAAAILLCFLAVFMKPVLLSAPEEARTVAKQMMDAIPGGDFEAVSRQLRGNPELGADRRPDREAGQLLWEAYLESFSYEFQGPCYAGPNGVAVDVQVTYLDFNSVIENLGIRTEKILQEKVAAAEDSAKVYDGDGHYLPEVIDAVLRGAVNQGLQEDGKTVTKQLTLQLAFEDGRWWVEPTGALLHVLSGGTAGTGR